VRLGVYNILLEKFTVDGQTPGFLAKASLGLTAGAIGAFCGTPADVALVRMCVDNRRGLIWKIIFIKILCDFGKKGKFCLKMKS